MNNSPPNRDYLVVPESFPRSRLVVAAVSGKLTDALEEYDGKIYAIGSSPISLWSSWEICEELAQYLANECRELRSGAWAHLSVEEILENQYLRISRCGWGTECETRWIIHRVAALL